MSPERCLLFSVQNGLTEGLQQTISSVTTAAVAADVPDRGDTSAALRHHPLTSQLNPDVIQVPLCCTCFSLTAHALADAITTPRHESSPLPGWLSESFSRPPPTH